MHMWLQHVRANFFFKAVQNPEKKMETAEIRPVVPDSLKNAFINEITKIFVFKIDGYWMLELYIILFITWWSYMPLISYNTEMFALNARLYGLHRYL